MSRPWKRLERSSLTKPWLKVLLSCWHRLVTLALFRCISRPSRLTDLQIVTVNIQRSPLGGRSFESYAEDPYLSGTLASAYINGLQNKGVGAVIKHLVANDMEDDRKAVNSEVDERTLRGN
jgi:beta-glucosidase